MPRISREFVKLETRLLNDYRFFEMSERGQLAYIKLLVLGRTFDNKITKRLTTLKALLRVNWSEDDIALIISEIKDNFPNFKSNKYFHYFSGYEERLLRGKLKTPTSAANYCEDEDEDIDEDKDVDKEQQCTVVNSFWEYFLLKTNKQYKLNKQRKILIKQRLAEGYTLDQLKQAVDNFVGDDWAGRKDHMDLIYCIGKQKGKADNLEKWINKPVKSKDGIDQYIVEG
ncbi:MAG TPA: hypothetical protein ENH85_14515 [Candidatus Scalindua sp.]|nr:hypothetical protein [Candidatus Scalindua sp.]